MNLSLAENGRKAFTRNNRLSKGNAKSSATAQEIYCGDNMVVGDDSTVGRGTKSPASRSRNVGP